MIQASQASMKHDGEQYVNKAITLIHSPQTSPAILKMLDGNDPVQRVADAAVMIMQRIDSASRQAGIEVQDAIKIWGAHEIVSLIVEMAEAAGKFKLVPDLVTLALSTTVQDYINGEVSARRIDPQKLKVAMQADMRNMPPKMRKEAQQSQQRLPLIARKYNHGAGMAAFQ
jgi:hypothetical protein